MNTITTIVTGVALVNFGNNLVTSYLYVPNVLSKERFLLFQKGTRKNNLPLVGDTVLAKNHLMMLIDPKF